MERKEEEEEEKEGWKLGEVVSGGREGVEVSAKCGGEAKKCHTARDEIALLGVLRRDGTGGSFRAGRALRNASHTHSPRSKRKSKSVQPNLSSPSLRSSSKSTR